jgi:tripartite-type tricarboxylate transporter receptor subunit TctC
MLNLKSSINFGPSQRARRSPALLLSALLLAAPLLLPSAAVGQEWPSKPIRVVNPNAAGGVTEALFRAMSPSVESRLSTRMILDNKPGADGAIGGAEVARAAPDGYTLLLAPTASYSVLQHLYKNLTYDPINAYEFIGLLMEAPLILTVSNNVPARNMKEFIEFIRANPGKYNYGSPGSGSPAHLTMAQISQSTGNSMVYVPFKGTAPLALSMLSGDVHATTFSLVAVQGHLKAGKLRALAVTAKNRMADIPDVPTTAEAGFPQYSGTNWWVLSAPRGTSQKIIDRLWTEFRTTLADPEVQKRILATGHVTIAAGPTETLAFVRSEAARYKKIVEDGKITLD